jgi:Spy/CpxP family protein refolding chaperone
MRPWLRKTFVGLFGASVLFGGLSACSHHHHRDPSSLSEEDVTRLRERMLDRVAGELKLDAAQKQHLAVLAERLREQRRALMAGTPDPRAAVQDLVKDQHFDRWRAQELVTAKLGAIREASPLVITAAADFYDSLRPEQQQRVREFMSRRSRWSRWS